MKPDQIMTEFNSKDQKLIRDSKLGSGQWAARVSLCEFTQYVSGKPQNKCTRKHLRIKITFQEKQQRIRTRQALKVHVNHCSPYIQTYYELFQNKNDPLKLTIEAENYRLTLADVFRTCHENKIFLPPSTFKFVIGSILEIYKYLLYLLQLPENQKKNLWYDLCPENIAFSSDYRLILLYPCISGIHPFAPMIADESVNNFYRNSMIKVLKSLGKYLSGEAQDRGFLQFLCSEKKENRSFKEEGEMIRAWLKFMDNDMAISKQLYETLKKRIEPFALHNKTIESLPLLELYQEEEERARMILKTIQ